MPRGTARKHSRSHHVKDTQEHKLGRGCCCFVRVFAALLYFFLCVVYSVIRIEAGLAGRASSLVAQAQSTAPDALGRV
eukprot:1237283-Pyramimonas_sp.AAC.1